MDKDLERLLELYYEDTLGIDDSYHGLTKKEEKELEQLKSKLNEKLEKSQYCEEHHKIYETRCAPEKKRPTLKEQELEQQIKQLKEENSILKQGVFKDHEEIQSLKSQLEKYEYNGYQVQQSSLANELQQAYTKNEKLQKVIDEIRKKYYTKNDKDLADYIKSILSNLEVKE